MGLLTVRCVNPECRRRIRKGSRHCNTCGRSTWTGLTSCAECKAEVRNTSRFCWKCGNDLTANAKPLVADGRWCRSEGDFAVRVDDVDVKGCLFKSLVVEEGTEALLMQDGQYRVRMCSGRHDINGAVSRMVGLNLDRRAMVVLVDTGEISIDIENQKLITADPLEVGVCQRLVFRINDPGPLFTNLIKGKHRVTVDDLEMELAQEVQPVLANLVVRHRAEELFGQLQFRDLIERELRGALARPLESFGLELVQLRFLSFTGSAYEEILRANADVLERQGKTEAAEQRLKVQQRLREAIGKDQMHKVETNGQLREFIRRTEHEIGLKDVIRDDEMQRLMNRFEDEQQLESVVREIERRTTEDQFERQKAWEDLNALEDRRDESLRRNRQRHQAGMEMLQNVKNMELLESQRELELERTRLEQRSQATTEALLSILDGPQADRIAELEKLRQQQVMTPEQMLALAASCNPEVATALGRKYQAEQTISADQLALFQQQLAMQQGQQD